MVNSERTENGASEIQKSVQAIFRTLDVFDQCVDRVYRARNRVPSNTTLTTKNPNPYGSRIFRLLRPDRSAEPHRVPSRLPYPAKTSRDDDSTGVSVITVALGNRTELHALSLDLVRAPRRPARRRWPSTPTA
jgi:hypothetical protein